MSDKISIIYDANVDALKTKLEVLIAKNQQLSNAANTAQRAMSGLNSSVSATNNAFNQSTTVINNYNNSVNTTNNSINNMNNSLNNTRGQLGLLDGFLSRIALRMAAVFAIDSIIGFGKSVVDVTRKTELLQNRLAFTYGSLIEGQIAFDRLYKVSKKLGLEFTPLVEGFSKFSIAAKFAGFSARQSEDMFVKVASGLRAAGASSLQTQRAFLALEQMLSKGVVAAEELRRQLGEALPGAVSLMTQAYNELHPGQELSIRQFMKLQEEGKVISAEVLPQFANVIERTLAPALAGKAGSLDAAINRMNVSFENIKRTFGMANLQGMVNAFTAFGQRLENVASVIAKPVTDQEQDPMFGRIFTAAQSLNQFIFGDWLGDAKAAKKELEDDYKGLLETGLNLAKGYATLAKKSTDVVDPKTLNTSELISAMQMIAKEYKKIDEQSLIKTPEQVTKLRGLQIAHGELNAILTEQAQKEQQLADKKLQNQALYDKQYAKRLKQAEDEMVRTKKLYEDSLKDGKSSREDQLKLQKNYVDAYVNYEVQQQKALENEKAAIRLKKQQEVDLDILNMDLAALEKQLIEYKQYGHDTTYVEKQIKDKKIEILKLTARTKQELDLGIAQFEEKERQEKSEKDTAALEKELNAFIAAQEQKISQTKDGSDERLRLQNELLDKEEEYEKRIVDASILLTDEKESKKLEITAKYAVKRRRLNEKDEKQEENHAERIRKILQESQDLIERSEGDSFRKRIARTKQMFEKMARDIKDAMSKTQDFEVLGELTKALGEVEAAGKRATDSIELEQVAEIIGGVGNVYSEIAKMQSVAYDNEEIALKRQLEQKLISEQEYERKAAELAKRRFEHEKKAATVSAIIDGALGVMKAIGKGRWWEVAAITAATGIQIATIQSQQFPGFKEGVIDLQGPGTATSDSIPARLSRGESVMTAEETTKYKPVLQAIRDNEFEAFVAKRYTDVMRKQSGNAGLGSSFAENVSNSFDMQTAELATLLKQNRRVAIKNVDELAKAISRRSTTDKVINRRRFK